MKLNQPKFVTWAVAVFLGVIGLVFVVFPSIGFAAYGVWLALVGLALLAVANAVKGL